MKTTRKGERAKEGSRSEDTHELTTEARHLEMATSEVTRWERDRWACLTRVKVCVQLKLVHDRSTYPWPRVTYKPFACFERFPEFGELLWHACLEDRREHGRQFFCGMIPCCHRGSASHGGHRVLRGCLELWEAQK